LDQVSAFQLYDPDDYDDGNFTMDDALNSLGKSISKLTRNSRRNSALNKAAENEEPDEEVGLDKEDLIEILEDRAVAMVQKEAMNLPTLFWDPEVTQEAKILSNVGMLLNAYEIKFWWFEIFEMMRKLLMISVLTLLDSTELYMVTGLIVTFAALVLTAQFRPYVDPRLDHLQSLSLIVTCITLFYGLLLTRPIGDVANPKGEDGTNSSDGWILIVLNLLIFLLPVGELLFGGYINYDRLKDFCWDVITKIRFSKVWMIFGGSKIRPGKSHPAGEKVTYSTTTRRYTVIPGVDNVNGTPATDEKGMLQIKKTGTVPNLQNRAMRTPSNGENEAAVIDVRPINANGKTE
jgi:hypothetical protein